MADKHTHVSVGKRTVALSNLEKPLYSHPTITKAEVISYYFQAAPYILRHSKGRPISTIRYPDGIDGENFYFKDIPSWAPDWIQTVRKGKEHPKNYLLLNEEAAIVWLANLAALEIHQTSTRESDNPDYIVYDLDPPETMSFEEVKDLAFRLKDHLIDYQYKPYVKVTGSKGIHIFTPVNPRNSISTCLEAASNCVNPFIKKNTNTTLEISKKRRKDRLLIDIYRNREGQTVISPYSLRGREEAPVSMPLFWEELDEIQSSREIVHARAIELLNQRGDAWEGMGAFSVPLHTDKEIYPVEAIGGNAHRKSPQQLQEYAAKRDFERTPEPNVDYGVSMDDTAFVIHRHRATRLHYDLRLAQSGILKSWALPKGLPDRPGVKRLAVQTEDHPMEYLSFEGEIPKEEYGGGRMWIYKTGKYEIIKEKKDGFYFRLTSPTFQGEYRMHNTKEKEWLLERVDQPISDWLIDPPKPMLASQLEKVPRGDYIYELKWDGIRAILVVEEGETRVFSRSGKNISAQFPEVVNSKLTISSGVLDAEIVCFDNKGKPDFRKVMGRLHKKTAAPANAYAYVFDLLYADGVSIMKEPLWKRRAWARECVGKQEDHIRFSVDEADGRELFKATQEMGLEGIIAKRSSSRYEAGQRSEDWVKVKSRKESNVVIIGFTKGENERSGLFGALHIAEDSDKGLIYRGKAANGLTLKQMKQMSLSWPEKQSYPENLLNRPADKPSDTWVQPEWYMVVSYASITSNGMFREPVITELKFI